jgi:hypothetical protein
MLKAHEGNVTIITALTACLLLLVVFMATGVGQNASGSTRMQASTDGAALTAASGYIMALNDDTLLDTIQWAVDAVGRLGTALQVAGAVIISIATAAAALSLGLASAASAVLIAFGTTLISAGSTLRSVSSAMNAVVKPFIKIAKVVVDIAKYVLAIANSTIIASNNGFLGFMLPAGLKPAGALKYDKTDADKAVRHANSITSDTQTPDSDGQGIFLKASLKETLRRGALRDLWTGGGAKQPRGHNTFQIWDKPTPGCDASKVDTWEPVGVDPSAVAIGSDGILVQPTPIPRDCGSEFKYFKQLLDRSFNSQIVELKTLRAKMNIKDAFDESQGSLTDANKEIDDKITDLKNIVGGAPQGPSNVSVGGSGPQSDLFPSVPSGKNNQDWASYVYAYYHSKDRGQACKGADKAKYDAVKVPFMPFGDGSDNNNQTFFGCVVGEPPTAPVNPDTVPGPHSLKEVKDKTPDNFYWWTGQQNRDVQPADKGLPSPPENTACCFDFRNTEDYLKNKRFVGDPQAVLAYLSEVLRYGHTTAGADATNPITFLAFQKLDPTYMQEATARLSGKPKPPSQYSLAASQVQVKMSPDNSDTIRFNQFCEKLFAPNGPPNAADDHSLLGFLPANGAAWCASLANLLIGAASFINDAPEPISSLLKAIFGDPPPVRVYHAELHVPAATPEICEAINVVKEVVNATKKGDSVFDIVWKEATNPPKSLATSC